MTCAGVPRGAPAATDPWTTTLSRPVRVLLSRPVHVTGRTRGESPLSTVRLGRLSLHPPRILTAGRCGS